jgi:ribonucleoside-diphosphate reductase alpha chain
MAHLSQLNYRYLFYAVEFLHAKIIYEFCSQNWSNFDDFDKSAYADGTYFDQYIEDKHLSDKVATLFEGIHSNC